MKRFIEYRKQLLIQLAGIFVLLFRPIPKTIPDEELLRNLENFVCHLKRKIEEKKINEKIKP